MQLKSLNSVLLNIDFSLPWQDPVLIFSLVLFIILLAPVILRKFRIPSIIGLIIAGVIIGPYGFHLINRDSSIELFGTVGLLYIMFIAGLELDLNEFKKNQHKSVVFGFLTFIFPFTIGIALCHFVLDLSYLASILVASMFSTHTLVSYPIASKLGITKNESVTISVGGTIITDTAVLLILAIITAADKGNLNMEFWVRLGISLVVFFTVIFFLFPIVGRWFFKTTRGDNVSEYIFVLGMVFLAAFLAELAGVEAIIGAFMAGLALNRLIPHTSPIMNRIEFVGNALFIPFFLIGVGMLVDMSVLLEGWDTLLDAAILLLAAFIGKWIAALITQKVFGYSRVERNVIFGLTSSHAAATLAVILIGFNLGIVDDNILNGTIILILVSCLVSSFITENAGRKLAIKESKIAPAIPDELERILVPISNPLKIEQLMDFAIMLRNPQSTSPIYSLSVVKDDEEAARRVLESNQMLEGALKHASATDSEVRILTRVDLSAVSGISKAMKEILGTDLIMGWSEKISTTDRLFGTKLGSLLGNVWKTIYVCHFIQPISTAKRMIILMPRYAEYEIGFGDLILKISKLSVEVGANIVLYSSEDTYKVFIQELQQIKSSAKVKFHLFEHPEDFLLIARKVTKNDLFMVVSARKRTISYEPFLDNVPTRLSRYFKENNFILVYPEQHTVMTREPIIQTEDVNLSPIREQLAHITRFGRAVKRVFNPKKHKEETEEEANSSLEVDPPAEDDSDAF